MTIGKKIEQFKLSNNLPVILVDYPGAPSVATGFMVKIGERDGGMEKAEISHVLEHLLFDGSKEIPGKMAVKVAFDEIGADFDFVTTEEYTYGFIKVEPRSFVRSLFLLSQVICYPLLKEEELAKEKQIILQELNMREDDPIIKSLDLLQETLFPNHPLGCSKEAGLKSIPKLTRNDLVAHWRKNYVSGSLVLVICGDLGKLGKVEDLAERYFKGLNRGVREPLEKASPEEKGVVRVIDKKISQSHLTFGWRGYCLDDKKVYAARLFDFIFGHGFSSRLFQEIREERKLAYVVSSGIDFYQDTGTFFLYAGVDATRLTEALAAIKSEMKKITDDGKDKITEKELLKAKNYFRGKTLVQMDDPANQFMFYARRFLFNQEVIFPEELLKRYEKVKREELVEVARDLFKPEKINLVVMGEGIDKKALEEQLR